MIVLGIESSCDETAASIVIDGHDVRANVVSSQVKKHAEYGGVIPELAAREHLKAIDPIVQLALREANLSKSDLDAVSVTATPGLLPALLVGITYAKGLAASLKVPFIGINHMIGHIYGAFIESPEMLKPDAFPVLALIVSGGHTMLMIIHEDGACELVGQTIDDAAGEAFDKAAKILHLPYPGGPVIDKLAKQGNPAAINFPRALTGASGNPLKPEHKYNFSYSGVKTALLYNARKDAINGDETLREMSDDEFHDLVASYQEAVVDILVRKTGWVARDYNARSLVVCGGVACNSRLRTLIKELADEHHLALLIAPPKYCTDNAAMIAGLSYYYLRHGATSDWQLDATPRIGRIRQVPFAPAYKQS